MTTDQKILNFNHISKNLSDDKIKEIKDLYKYYHIMVISGQQDFFF